MIYLMDTDHMSILDRDSVEAFNLGRRLAAVLPEEVATSIVTYEEQMRGWLAVIAKAQSVEKQVAAYARYATW